MPPLRGEDLSSRPELRPDGETLLRHHQRDREAALRQEARLGAGSACVTGGLRSSSASTWGMGAAGERCRTRSRGVNMLHGATQRRRGTIVGCADRSVGRLSPSTHRRGTASIGLASERFAGSAPLNWGLGKRGRVTTKSPRDCRFRRLQPALPPTHPRRLALARRMAKCLHFFGLTRSLQRRLCGITLHYNVQNVVCGRNYSNI